MIELSSGNYIKSLNYSEHLILKNNSNGWALKALSQIGLSDYSSNFNQLNAGIQSIRKYKSLNSGKSSLVFEIQAVFIHELLLKTETLVNEKLQEIEEMHLKARGEKRKRTIATVATIFSYLYASNSKSRTAKFLGYGATVAGYVASNHFKKNALLISNAAKGELAETVSNISITIEMASKLKKRTHLLESNLKLECNRAVKQYMVILVNVYDRVITNYVQHYSSVASANPFTKYFYINAINISESIEGSQFIYFSDALKIQNRIPVYLDLQKQIKALNLVKLKDVKRDLIKMHLLCGGICLLGIFILLISKNVNPVTGPTIFWVGISLYIYFRFFPIGELRRMKTNIRLHQKFLTSFIVGFEKVKNSL
ncbi:MAG: hypothetical protein P8O83_02010 [Flavobacteriaceae bacterium]|nr:hypothetical protein [Flavobacteriaceae bacterium]